MTEVCWELSNGEKTDQKTGLKHLKEGTTEFLICSREGDVFLQAYKEDEDLFHCEIVFSKSSANPVIFAAPEGVKTDELDLLYERFAGGEDFSFVEKEWEALTAVVYKHNHVAMWLIFLAILTVVVLVTAYRHEWL